MGLSTPRHQRSGQTNKRVTGKRASWLAGLLLAVVGCAFLLTGCADTQALTPIATLPTPTPGASQSVSLQTIHMLNARDGWAITHDTHILHTSDGPANWTDVTPGVGTANMVGATIQASYFMDQYNGWIATSINGKLTIWSTSDGGSLWYPTALAETGDQVTSLQFTDAVHGWLLLSSGITATNEAISLLTTPDGGSTWLPVDSATTQDKDVPQHLPFSGVKTGMTFTDNADGWLTGSLQGTNSQPLALYVSTNGGESWEARSLAVPTPKASALRSYIPDFFDPGNAILPVTFDAPQAEVSIYQTSDGGNHWRSSQPDAAISSNISFVNVNDGWAIGNSDHNTTVYATTNGGQTWQPTAKPGAKSAVVDSIDFISPTDGWILINNSTSSTANSGASSDELFQTQDGGKSWSAQNTMAVMQ